MALWTLRLRESIPEGEKEAGGSVKHDIPAPLGAIETFLRAVARPRRAGVSVRLRRA